MSFNSVCNVSSTSDFNKGHARLGHPFDKHLFALKDILKFDTFHITSQHSCLVCPLSKQKCLSFHAYNNIADKPFDLVHCDI